MSARISCGSSIILDRPTALTLHEEVYLVKSIETLQEWGELCTMQDVMKYATEYVNLIDVQSRFKLNGPTKVWYYGFVKRWSYQLKIMKSCRPEKSKAGLKKVVDGRFSNLYSVLKKLNLLNKPKNIFTANKSDFGDDC